MIEINHCNGFYLIWNSEDVALLRRQYRIIGNLIGSMPEYPRSTSNSGLPLLLLPEEVRLLLTKFPESFQLISSSDKHQQELIWKSSQYQQFYRKLSLDYYDEINEKSKLEKRKQIEINLEQIVKGKLKKLKTTVEEDLDQFKKRIRLELIDGIRDISVEQLSTRFYIRSPFCGKILDSNSEIEDSSSINPDSKSQSNSEIEASSSLNPDSSIKLNSEIEARSFINLDTKIQSYSEFEANSIINPNLTIHLNPKIESNSSSSPNFTSKSNSEIEASSFINPDSKIQPNSEIEASSSLNPDSSIKSNPEIESKTTINQNPTIHSYPEIEASSSINPNSFIKSNSQIESPSTRIITSLDPLSPTSFSSLKYAVFFDFWNKGYYLTDGMKFGANFLAYDHDPIGFHAKFIIICLDSRTKFDPLLIQAYGRLGKNVRKNVLLASWNSNDNSTVEYQHVRWNPIEI